MAWATPLTNIIKLPANLRRGRRRLRRRRPQHLYVSISTHGIAMNTCAFYFGTLLQNLFKVEFVVFGIHFGF